MTLAAPWALIGLVALPVIWWVQRHRQKAVVVELPTLMFVLEEDERVHQPRKRRLDAETVIALITAALLSLAAAGPTFARGEPVKRVRVVVAGGAPAHAEGYVDRVERVVRAIEATGADVHTTWMPEHGDASRLAGRPAPDALLGAVRAGEATLRILVGDRVPAEAPADVRWVGVGDAEARNIGIVGARLLRRSDRPAVFVTLREHPVPAAAHRVEVEVNGLSQPIEIGADGYGAATLTVPDPAAAKRVRIVRAGWASGSRDALAADDQATLVVVPLAVDLASGLGPAARAALERALRSAVGAEALVESSDGGRALRIGTWDRPADLQIGAVDEGGSAVTAPRGSVIRQNDPLVADLDPSGVTFVYRAGDETPRPGERVLLGIRADDRTWPLVTRDEDGRVRFAPDPTRGDPAPADAPLWPLFIDNWVRAQGAFGVQVQGLLDPDASALGSDTRPFDPAWVAGAAADVEAPALALRLPLCALSVLLLGVLWALPVLRRRSAGAGAVAA